MFFENKILVCFGNVVNYDDIIIFLSGDGFCLVFDDFFVYINFVELMRLKLLGFFMLNFFFSI